MKAIKKILIVLAVLVGIILIAAAVMPKELTTERSTVINAPASVIYGEVIDLEKYVEWMPWSEKDPNMEVTWPEGKPKAGLGASYSWTGNEEVGWGTMTVIDAVENESITNEVAFQEWAPGPGTWKFEEGEEGTTVTWGMTMTIPYPMNVMGPFIPGPGEDFEKGLANLKERAEAMPATPASRIDGIEQMEMTEAQPFIYIEESVSFAEISQAMGRLYGELGAFLGENGLEMTDKPLTVYTEWTEEGTTMRPGFLVAEPITETDRIKNGELAAGSYVRAIHVGSYDGLQATHEAIDAFITENNLQATGFPCEHYVDDPGDMSDMSEVKTIVYYPVAPAEDTAAE